MTRTTLLGSILLCAASACGDGARDLDALRQTINEAQVEIGPMATLAEASIPAGRVVTAELRAGTTSVYAYGTMSAWTLHDVHIDTIDGQVVSAAAAGTGWATCPGSISMSEAIAIAEGQVADGTVIAAIPDDDVSCARELQVLTPDLLWEVKVAADGRVLEVEESDEDED
jgi:hypothetical protein